MHNTQNEPRVTFVYLRVKEDLTGTFMELSPTVHNQLSNPKDACLFEADLKYAYLTIPLYP